MGKGMGGGGLHGGGADRASLINSSFFNAGQFYTGMVVVVFFLAPEGPGDGGLGSFAPVSCRFTDRTASSLCRSGRMT